MGASAVVDDGNPENAAFFAATPSGQINLGVVSKEAADFFEPGKSYLVRFERPRRICSSAS